MNKITYFYRDINGKIKRYCYCLHCRTRFTQNQINYDVIEYGAGKQKSYICKKCVSNSGMEFPESYEDSCTDPEYNEPLDSLKKKTITSKKDSIEQVPDEKQEIPSVVEEKEDTLHIEEEDPDNSIFEYNKEGIPREKVRDLIDIFMYVVRCSDDSLYPSVTSNLFEAIGKHNRGQMGSYTRERKPVTLIAYKQIESRKWGKDFIKNSDLNKIINFISNKKEIINEN